LRHSYPARHSSFFIHHSSFKRFFILHSSSLNCLFRQALAPFRLFLPFLSDIHSVVSVLSDDIIAFERMQYAPMGVGRRFLR
jgi:hypothetical protein